MVATVPERRTAARSLGAFFRWATGPTLCTLGSSGAPDGAAQEDIVTYNHTRDALVDYLHRKVAEQDWPAVCDAANDLSIFEILEARSMAAGTTGAGRSATAKA